MRYILAVQFNVSIGEMRRTLATVTISQMGYAVDTQHSIFDLRTRLEWDRTTVGVLAAMEEMSEMETGDLNLEEALDHSYEVNEMITRFAFDCGSICEDIKDDSAALLKWEDESMKFTGAEIGMMVGYKLQQRGWNMAIMEDGILQFQTAVA